MIEIYERRTCGLVYCGSGAEPIKFRDERDGFKPEVGQYITYDVWHESKPLFAKPMRYHGVVVEVLWQVHGGVVDAAVIVERSGT